MISLLWMILLPLLIAVLSYLLGFNKIKVTILGFQCIFFIMAVANFLTIKAGNPLVETLGGYERSIGITLYCDVIASVFVMLNVFLFTCMLLYSFHKTYMNKLFILLFLILQGLLNGIFLANDLFTIYVLIELATLVVSILIMFKKDSSSIYDGMIYLLVNIVAMTFFLLGIGYLYKITGTLDMTVLHEKFMLIEDVKALILPYCLIMTAIGLKAAIFPLFSWLPRAHGTPSAPSIVSAILSGLYVKGGLYLFIRVQDMFKPQLNTDEIFLILGFLTAIIGFVIALSQIDLKLILAYSTVSQIGLIVFGLSLNHENSYWGSIYHIVNHAIFKSVLFLTAGIIIETYETRDIRQIRGVFKRMPFVTVVNVLAILGITGAPLFNGSISKYLIQKGTTGGLLEYGLLLINLGTIVAFVRYSSIFKGAYKGEKMKLPLIQGFVIGLLGVICLTGGLLGTHIIRFLFVETVQVTVLGYLQKSFFYLCSWVIGILFYKYFYAKIKVFKKIQKVELSFNAIVLSIVIFFSGLLSFMLLLY